MAIQSKHFFLNELELHIFTGQELGEKICNPVDVNPPHEYKYHHRKIDCQVMASHNISDPEWHFRNTWGTVTDAGQGERRRGQEGGGENGREGTSQNWSSLLSPTLASRTDCR